MGFRLHLFAAACVLALALVSEVHGQTKCTTATWGYPGGIPYHYEPLYLHPKARQWQVTIEDVCIGDPNGLVATVCDFDVPPTATFLNQHILFVQRNGAVQGDATVDITAYCKQLSYGGHSKLSPDAHPITPKKISQLIH